MEGTMDSGFRILVVDDDKLSRITTARQLEENHYATAAADSPFAALKMLAEGLEVDVVLTDLRMPGMDGLAFLERLQQEHPDLVVVLMTAFGTVETAVRAMRLGASDFLTKPFQFEELELRLARLAREKATEAELEQLRGLVAGQDDSLGLIGASPGIELVRSRIRTFADHHVPVLVTGETGTGKEVVARALHRCGSRKAAPFIAVGCGNIPRELAESEFFGHERGSFTGANDRRIGSFERADGGTLLLDDIDDLPGELQVKLLRVLQEGTINRVGSTEEIPVNVRVVATTKIDLEPAAEAGLFRPDLFYRLRGLEIDLPPLRHRGDDVLLLADHFLRLTAHQEQIENKNLAPEAANLLRQYRWPGNVRELRRAMESSFVLAIGNHIDADSLPAFLHREHGAGGPFRLNLSPSAEVRFPELVHEFEASLLNWAMEQEGGSQSAAAKRLGIPRTTLQSKLGPRAD